MSDEKTVSLELNGGDFQEGTEARISGFDLVLKAGDSGDESKKLPTFEMRSYTGAPIRQWFSPNPIVIDLAGINVPNRSIPIRFGHEETRNGIGHTTEVKLEGGVLVARGVISRDTEAAREFVASSKNDFPWQASIGASIGKIELVKAGESTEVNGKTYDGPIDVVRASDLYEISVVDLGADSNTSAKVAASADRLKGQRTMSDEQNNGSGSGSGNLEASDQSTNTKSTALEDIKADAEKAKVEATRQSKISAAAREAMKKRPELADEIYEKSERAIEAGVSAGDFELEMMRTNRDIPGVGRSRSDVQLSTSMIEIGLAIEGGMSPSDLEKHYTEQELNAADKKFKGSGLSLQESLLMAAKPLGFDDLQIKAGNLSKVLRLIFGQGQDIQANFSTVDLPNAFSNVANKYLAKGFMSVDRSIFSIAQSSSTRDFKQVTSVAFGGDYIFKDLPAGGEIEHAVPDETVYTNQLGTKARMVGFTREQIINDDLSGITKTSQLMGRGSMTKLNADAWAEFEDNASFFTAGRNNRETGAGSALDIDALTAAETAFMDQTDPEGLPLGIMPEILLVPNELKATATQLVNSTEVRGQSGAFGTANPHSGNYRIVVSPYLTDATAWYLLADPMVLATLELLFLNGTRQPTVETAQADFNTLGIQMRGYFDFGVSKHEYRAGVANDGA